VLGLLLSVIVACTSIGNRQVAEDFRKRLPSWVKDSIYLAASNPYSSGKAALGRYFFYDRRLSVNQTKSCASCHDPAFSFTDGYRRSIGALGDNVQHNAPPLINIVFNKYLTAADSSLHFPEQQIRNPFFHRQPVELGWMDNEALILQRIRKDSLYRTLLPQLFAATGDPFTTAHVQACISSFVKSILSLDAPYDRFVYNKDSLALSASQLRGRQLFFSDSLHCSQCHGGINFSVPAVTDSRGEKAYYQNTGLYNIDGLGSFPAGDQGLFENTRQAADMGKYKIATLRNLAFTAPYLHDGSASSLEAVIVMYESGGRKIATGTNAGDGSRNPYKSPLVQGFHISPQQRKDLIDFLLSLSDSSACTNPAYGNPFLYDETHR